MARKRASAASARSTPSLAELAGRGDRAAEAAQHLLVEQRRRAAHGALVDDEAHGIRADVDDADRLELVTRLCSPNNRSKLVTCASDRLLLQSLREQAEPAAGSSPSAPARGPTGSGWS